jgi:sarcosine/dimethylglycine N-methyltransferase
MDVIGFYDRHPINEEQVRQALARRGYPQAPVPPDALFEFDMDHYGGLPAIEALARRAGIGRDSRVLDVGAGLGGPARFLAWRFGARAVGIELNAGRAAGARRLTAVAGLARSVHVVRGDATELPFRARSFDACLSQEALLHVTRKDRVLGECRRVLRAGGRLAFTDWIAHARLADRERARLTEWMAATSIPTLDGYRHLVARAGFSTVEAEDLSAEWIRILRDRLAMYRALRADTVARFGEAWAEAYEQLYAFFVGLVEAGKLGGGRFSATAA